MQLASYLVRHVIFKTPFRRSIPEIFLHGSFPSVENGNSELENNSLCNLTESTIFAKNFYGRSFTYFHK